MVNEEDLAMKRRRTNFSPPAPTFEKRPGTTDYGRDYENLVLARYVLAMVHDPGITNFQIWSNDAKYGAFDDLLIEIKADKKPLKKYALQLKHVLNEKPISLFQFGATKKAKKNAYSLEKYYSSYKENDILHDYNLILFTNAKLETNCKVNVTFEGDPVRLEIHEVKPDAFVVNNKSSPKCYQFSVSNQAHASQVQRFLKNFFVYTEQPNVRDLRREIEEMIQQKFELHSPEKDQVTKKYLCYISKWGKEDGNKKKILKSFAKELLAYCVVDPFYKSILFGEVSDHINLLQQTINSVHITIFEGNEEQVRKIWGDAKPNLTDLNNKAKEFRIIEERIENKDELDDKTVTILLWLLKEVPLIVSPNPSVYEAIKLCQDKKFIIVGKGIDEKFLSQLKKKKKEVFRRLSDLKIATGKVLFHLKNNHKWIKNAILEEPKKLYELLTTDDVLRMIDGPYKLENKEELDEPYYTQDTHVVVLCSLNDFNHLSTRLLQQNKKIVLKNATCLHWITQDQLYSDEKPNKVNVITGNPGLGKTCFLKGLGTAYFKKDTSKFPIYFSSDDISRISDDVLRKNLGNKKKKEVRNTFFNHVVNKKFQDYTELDKFMLGYMMLCGEIIYLWDGIYILSNQDIDNLLEFIKSLSECNNSIHYITSRKHLEIS